MTTLAALIERLAIAFMFGALLLGATGVLGGWTMWTVAVAWLTFAAVHFTRGARHD